VEKTLDFGRPDEWPQHLIIHPSPPMMMMMETMTAAALRQQRGERDGATREVIASRKPS